MSTATTVSIPVRILIADDQPHVGEALRLALRDEGFHIELAGSPSAVLTAVAAEKFDLALLDMNYARDTTSGREGIDLIERLRVIDSDMAIVVMTAWGSVEIAVEALQRGAGDFIQKPGTTRRFVVCCIRSLRWGARAERREESRVRTSANGKRPRKFSRECCRACCRNWRDLSWPRRIVRRGNLLEIITPCFRWTRSAR